MSFLFTESKGPEKLCSLSKVTKLVRDGGRIGTQAVWFQGSKRQAIVLTKPEVGLGAYIKPNFIEAMDCADTCPHPASTGLHTEYGYLAAACLRVTDCWRRRLWIGRGRKTMIPAVKNWMQFTEGCRKEDLCLPFKILFPLAEHT